MRRAMVALLLRSSRVGDHEPRGGAFTKNDVPIMGLTAAQRGAASGTSQGAHASRVFAFARRHRRNDEAARGRLL